MADEQDKDQKTEEASPHRLEQMREEGKSPSSQDIGAVAGLFAVLACLYLLSESAALSLARFAERCLRVDNRTGATTALPSMLRAGAFVVGPIGAASLVGFAAGFAQSRSFNLKNLEIKPERLDPFSNLKNILPGKTTAIEILKQLTKVFVVGYVAYGVIEDAAPMLSALPAVGPISSAAVTGELVGKLVTRVGVAFVTVAAGDYFLARYRFAEDAKMTKQEVKDEHKQMEGNPENKARQRRAMRDAAQNRSVKDLASATVVVTNPTHFSVALRYDPDRDGAPMVVAKGTDERALDIRKTARKSGIPVVENRPLARGLYAESKVGRPIPVEFYQATAEVIAFVMRLKNRGNA